MSAPNQSGWKPEMNAGVDAGTNGPATSTGNRALMLEEPLLFEIGHVEATRRRFARTIGGCSQHVRRAGSRRADGIARPVRTRNCTPLHAAEPAELRH